jgi:hypothetical protein
VTRLLAAFGALLLASATVPGGRDAAGARETRVEPWESAGPGIERGAVVLPANREGWRTRVVLVRLDPARYRFRLRARLRGGEPGWTVDRAPEAAALAINAGQYSGIVPWGWTVMGGKEIRPPGHGPLSTVVAWDRSGRVRWLAPAAIPAARASGEIVEAFQSYPTLIDEDGGIPRQLREPGSGVDIAHRDARLAIGALEDGRLLIALTRFYTLGPLAASLPLGPTLAEMAALMREQGSRRAVSLDGGISAQLMVREQGRRRAWRGWRAVPLGLVAEPVGGSRGRGE